jgi:hypothetical protein
MTLASKRAHLWRPFNARRAVLVSRVLVVLAGSIGLALIWILSHALYGDGDYGWLLLVLLFGVPISVFVCVRIIRDLWYRFARQRPHLATNGRYYLVIVGIIVLTAFLSADDRALRLRFVFEGSSITKTLDAVERRCTNSLSPRPTYRGRSVKGTCDGPTTSFTAGRWSFVLLGGDFGYVRSPKEPKGNGKYRKASNNIWVWTTADTPFQLAPSR